MFTSIFNELKSFYAARHEPESMRPLAEVYWRLLLSIALLMIVAILAYGAWEFFGVITNLDSGNTTSTPTTSSFDRNQLRSTLDAITARQHRFDNPASVSTPDPSK